MTWSITKTSFSFQNGTADVTARIRYIDGSDIYRETVTEFLRQIVSSAFSGESLTEQETQEKLAAILMEKSDSLEDKFSEADITYPMIKVDGQWKVTSLDDETVKIMSANFKSVEDEISQTLSASSEEADGSSSENAQAPAASDGTIDLSNERFSIHYTRNVVSTDFGGEPCLLVYYDYTNNGSGASSAMVDVNLTAYQNGASLEAAIPANSDSPRDQEIKLALRDCVLQEYGTQLSGARSREEAADTVRGLLPEIEKTCCEFLSQQGVDYGAEAELTEMYFPTRRYEQATLPAGEYLSLIHI